MHNVSMYCINSNLPERVGVGEASNSHYLIYLIQQHLLFIKDNNEQEKDLWGAALNRLRAFQLIIVYDSANYEGGMIDIAVIIT